MENDPQILLSIGFIDIGQWAEGAGQGLLRWELDGPNRDQNEPRLDFPNALYAFVHENQVKYIGKTARSLRQRFRGYCNPGPTQTTNIRCNNRIGEVLRNSGAIRIFFFSPDHSLHWGGFQINLAAGLEDALITQMHPAPAWNVAGAGNLPPITEDAEREVDIEGQPAQRDDEGVLDVSDRPSLPDPLAFTVLLGTTYYNYGFINPGVDASAGLGDHGDPVIIYLGDEAHPVGSKINRLANANGSVRLIGNNTQIAEWFRANFNLGDTVTAEVIDRHHILIHGP